MCGGFFLKFSNRKVNSEDRTTLTHNVPQIYLGFLFNIYTKITNEDEVFKNTTRVERSIRKLEYI